MGAKTNFSNVPLFKNVLALQIMPIDLDNLLLTYVICCDQSVRINNEIYKFSFIHLVYF